MSPFGQHSGCKFILGLLGKQNEAKEMKILSAFFLFLFKVFYWIYMAIAAVLFVIIAGVVMAPFIIFELLLGDK